MSSLKPAVLIVLAWSLASCGGSSDEPDGLDGSPKDGGRDTTSPQADTAVDQAPGQDLGTDGPTDLGVDVVLPPPDGPNVSEAGSEVGPDVSEAGGEVGPPADDALDGGQSCYWQVPGGRYMLNHFTFALTTPDGQAQTPPSLYPNAMDAGSPWPINDFEGRIVSQSGNRLSVDSCMTPGSCQPSLYQFVLCDSSACKAGRSAGNIQLAIPIGRRVRVVWHLDNEVPGFCPGIYWLAIYDAEPAPSQGSILFLGSGGLKPTAPGRPNGYFDALPFSVRLEALVCGDARVDAPLMGDDYAFVFSPKTGTGSTLRVATGESGTFAFTPASGPAEELQIHCLDAVQPAATDDYWNWDFWATGEVAPATLPVDAGREGGTQATASDSAVASACSACARDELCVAYYDGTCQPLQTTCRKVSAETRESILVKHESCFMQTTSDEICGTENGQHFWGCGAPACPDEPLVSDINCYGP